MPLCECGCGEEAGYFTKTKTYRNQKKDDPKRFISGHNTRTLDNKEQKRRGRCNTGSTLRGKGKSGWYIKVNGVHEHRIAAKQLLGRDLLPGEIVHHKDGNKQNNDINNLEVFTNQSEHCRSHAIEYHKNRRQNRRAEI